MRRPPIPSYALQTDLTGVRALPLLQGVADFDKLDGKMQAKIAVKSIGNSQRAIMSNMAGTVFVVFQDGAIRGLNVAQMIRSLTTSTQSGWQENKEQATDLSQLSASFKIDKGQATTYDLNLVGPLVKMTGVGTIDLGTKQMGFRVEPKLVMTTEGQGRANEPVGFGIPVIIDGPWAQPRIYPEMSGILENPDQAYAKLKEMGKGLFGPTVAVSAQRSAACSAAAQQPGAGGQTPGQQPGALGGNLGETLGNLLQQGLGGLNAAPAPGSAPSQAPPPRTSSTRESRGRSIPSPGTTPEPVPAPAPVQAAPQQAAPAPAQNEPPQDSQAMNEVLRQLFNR